MVVHASVRMLIPPQKRDEVLGILGSLSQKTRYEPGCISCRVYRGEEEEDGILLEELWSDEEASGTPSPLIGFLQCAPAFGTVKRSPGIQVRNGSPFDRYRNYSEGKNLI